MEIKFVPSNSDGSAQKRKQIQRACDACRKRKKRCGHTSSLENPAGPGPKSRRHLSGQPIDYCRSTLRGTASTDSPASKLQRTGFESDGPDGVLPSPSALPPPFPDGAVEIQEDSRSQTASHSNEDTSGPSTQSRLNVESPTTSRFVGDLNPEAVFLSQAGPRSRRHESDQDRIGVWLANEIGRTSTDKDPTSTHNSSRHNHSEFLPPVLQAFRPYLENECLSTIPPDSEVQALTAIYFSKIHPVIPILDVVGFNNGRYEGPALILLKQAICLVASKDTAATDHLALLGRPNTVSHREFAGRLSDAIKTSLNIGIVNGEKVLQTQILSLLALHSDGAEGGEESSMHLAQAIHHSQTIGLHLGRSATDQNSEYVERLFCCLWGLDKLNAAVNGRPIMIQDRDIGIDMRACFQRQAPEFGIFLQVTKILDKVIELYRPSADPSITGWEDDFPGFEELVIQCGGNNVNPSLLATVEVFYHAVAILSCRARSFQETPRSTPSYVRQSLSAMRIRSIVGTEYHQQLTLLPFIPYGLSLSMSVAYRQLRQSRILMHRTRARTDFQVSCTLLQELGTIFWSAEAMARLGQRTLREMDKASSTSDTRRRKRPRRALHAKETRQTLGSPQKESGDRDRETQRMTETSDELPLSSLVQGRPVSTQDIDSPNQITSDKSALFSPAPGSSATGMSDTDILTQWDLDFNFEDIDAVFGGQLDLSFPTNFDELLMMGDPLPV